MEWKTDFDRCNRFEEGHLLGWGWRGGAGRGGGCGCGGFEGWVWVGDKTFGLEGTKHLKRFDCLRFVWILHPFTRISNNQMFSLICAWTNSWANNRYADDVGRLRTHCDVTVMIMSNSADHDCNYIIKISYHWRYNITWTKYSTAH